MVLDFSFLLKTSLETSDKSSNDCDEKSSRGDEEANEIEAVDA